MSHEIAEARLTRLVEHHPGEALPLDRAVADLAAGQDPSASPDVVLAQLDALAKGLWIPPEEPITTSVARLVQHLFVDHGFAGDAEDYGAPDNSLIHRVLVRRRGMPILLSVVAIEVGRRAGLTLTGVGFPGHFLVGVVDEGEVAFYLDPFHRGEIHTRATLEATLLRRRVPERFWARSLQPCSTRSLLTRICNNLERSYRTRGEVDAAARVARHRELFADG